MQRDTFDTVLTTESASFADGPLAVKAKALMGAVRPSTRLWFDVCAPAAMMVVASDGWPPAARFVGVLAATALFHGGANCFNDLADTEVDRQSTERVRSQRALVSDRVSRRELQVVGWAMVASALAISALLPWPSISVVGIILLLELAYDFEPLHLSNRPLVLQVFWPLVWGFLFLFCVVATQAKNWQSALPFALFVAIFMGLGEGITQDVRDADNDSAGGRVTTPIALGVPRAIGIAWMCQAISLPVWIWFAVSYPLPVLATFAGIVVIAGWLVRFLAHVRVLRSRFDKASARMVHLGPVVAFSLINICAIAGVIGG